MEYSRMLLLRRCPISLTSPTPTSLLQRYSPKVKRDEGLEGESAGDDLAQLAKEDERRMNFSFAVAEMIAMESHTKQLLLQVMFDLWSLAQHFVTHMI